MPFRLGATKGSPDTISTMPFNTRGQTSVDPQKTTHLVFQLNWHVPVQASTRNVNQLMACYGIQLRTVEDYAGGKP